MGIVYRRRVSLGHHVRLNISGHGLSVSAKLGPVAVNSRGRVSVRLGRGLSYRARLFGR